MNWKNLLEDGTLQMLIGITILIIFIVLKT
jgi:hypothetical protein